MRIASIAAIVLLVGCPGPASEPTPTGPVDCTPLTNAEITAGGTLDGCYDVGESIYIDGDLVIEAGTVLTMAPDTAFEILQNGSIVANGTPTEPIVFQGESDAADLWMGLAFRNSGSPTNALTNVTVANACADQWNGADDSTTAIYVEDSTRLAMTDVTIDACSATGVFLWQEENQVTIDGLSTTDTVGIPAQMALAHAADLTGTLAFAGTDTTVHIWEGRIHDAMTLPAYAYTIDEPFEVAGADLTIAAGTTLYFEQDIGLDVYDGGSLNMAGTADAPILLDGVEDIAGYWKGIHMVNSSSLDNVFDHVTIDDAGSDNWHGGDDSKGGLYLQDDEVRLTVSNSAITDCEGTGLLIDGGDPAGKISIASTSIATCDEAVMVTPDAVAALASDVTFTGSTTNHIRVHGSVGGEVLDEDHTWVARDVPYHVARTVYVEGSLHIDAGATVEFADDTGLVGGDWIDGGGLLTIGDTSGAEVLLTGASPVQGFWKGVNYINTGDANFIHNTRIEYAGSSGWDGSEESQAGLYLSTGSNLEITDVTFADNERADVYVGDTSTLTGCTGVTGTVDGSVDATFCVP